MSKRWLCISGCLWLLTLMLFSGCKPSDSPSEVGTPTATPLSMAEIVGTETPSAMQVPPEPTLPVTVTLPTPTLISPPGLLDAPRTGGALGELWHLVDFRYGAHGDHLRVVWELAERRQSLPKYRVVEVDNAAQPFPGGADPGWGVARIDVVFSAVYADDYPLASSLPVELGEDPVVMRLGSYPTEDAALLGFSIGLAQPVRYEIYELSDPVRLVIDVLYP
ncbi:MAG: hypothetical protein U9Q70_05330 [Chloroflexota bacterium]|nr:hypothetical protein [Chloroflexota bacterium]